MSLADIKMDFTDKEGNIDVEEMGKYLAEGFAKNNLWFKDPSMTLDLADDMTILEANCITESSFKSILTEAGYEGDINKVQKYGTWKYYFDLLMSCPKTEEAVKNIRDMDVHFGDEEGEGEGSRDAQEARDKVMMEAARNSNKHDIPGNLRDHIKNLFDKYSKEDALPWNVILRRMVNASKRSIKKNDVNSRNKYAPGNQILPGYRLDPIKDVAVIWDVSGSCMDEETQTTFIKEVNMMIKSGSQIRVYYTDSAVEHIQDCKEKMMKPKDYEITGGGGTLLDEGVKAAIKDGYRIIIQLSDNYMDFTLSKKDLKGRKVINVSTTDAKQPSFYGPQIHVNRK
jgi:predicted metal-dependent peptidase